MRMVGFSVAQIAHKTGKQVKTGEGKMNGNETHQNPSLTENDTPAEARHHDDSDRATSEKIVALLENQIADLKAQLTQASDRETSLITEKSKLLDLTDRLQKQNEVLMLPAPQKKRSWLDRLTGR